MYFPSQHEFRQLAARGNLIPVARRILADASHERGMVPSTAAAVASEAEVAPA